MALILEKWKARNCSKYGFERGVSSGVGGIVGRKWRDLECDALRSRGRRDQRYHPSSLGELPRSSESPFYVTFASLENYVKSMLGSPESCTAISEVGKTSPASPVVWESSQWIVKALLCVTFSLLLKNCDTFWLLPRVDGALKSAVLYHQKGPRMNKKGLI